MPIRLIRSRLWMNLAGSWRKVILRMTSRDFPCLLTRGRLSELILTGFRGSSSYGMGRIKVWRRIEAVFRKIALIRPNLSLFRGRRKRVSRTNLALASNQVLDRIRRTIPRQRISSRRYCYHHHLHFSQIRRAWKASSQAKQPGQIQTRRWSRQIW